MQNALVNFFNFVDLNIITPLRESFMSTGILNSFLSLLERILSAFFKLWNNENIIDFSNSLILRAFCQFLGLLFILFILKFTISIFNVIFNTIRGNIK